MNQGRKRTFAMLAGLLGPLFFLFHPTEFSQAKEADYPAKPMNFYISYGAGGAADLVYRAFCDHAQKFFGQSFVPINKVGAGGTLAAASVLNAKPDGYSFASSTCSNLLIMPISGQAPYKDLSGLTLMGSFTSFTFPCAVRSDSPWKTWKEVVEWARKNPRALKVGIAGGAKWTLPNGLCLAAAEIRENIEFTYIPRKATNECLADILGGHIQMFAAAWDPAMTDYVKEGKLRLIAFTDNVKVPGWEGVPSFQEIYGFSAVSAMGVMGPKGLPDYVLKKWDDVLSKVVKDPDFRKAMAALNYPIAYMSRTQYTKYIQDEQPRISEIIRKLKAEEEKEKK